jgi:hypothetical protein
LIAVITPSYFNSNYCRKEAETFFNRESQLGRDDLIIPIYYVECGLEDKDFQAKDALAKRLSARHYFDWRQLRAKPFTDPLIREQLSILGQQITEAIRRSKLQLSSDLDDDRVNEIVGEIRAILREIQARVDGSTFRRRFRAEVIRRVLDATHQEIRQLSGPLDEYEQNLRLQENFIVRAGAIFEEAENIYAISIDELSGFWIAEDQRRQRPAILPGGCDCGRKRRLRRTATLGTPTRVRAMFGHRQRLGRGQLEHLAFLIRRGRLGAQPLAAVRTRAGIMLPHLIRDLDLPRRRALMPGLPARFLAGGGP